MARVEGGFGIGVRLTAAIFVLALLCPNAAGAQSLGRHLDDPRAGERTSVSIVSDARDDRVTVGDQSCDTPCVLALLPGTHEVEFRSGPSKAVVLGEHRTLLTGRPSHVEEQVVGVGLIIIAAALAITLGVTGDIVCWDFDSAGCSPDIGPVMIGAGIMSLAIGVALVFDGDAHVRVSVLGGPR